MDDGTRVELAVLGAHLRGQPLVHQLEDRGGVFVREARTSPDYRFYALAGTSPPKPGLLRVRTGGASIALEIWSLSEQAFGSFVAAVPRPLAIGTLTLEDGGEVAGFLCESEATGDAEDITALGGWRAFLARG